MTTEEEKAVIDAAIELHRTPGYLQYFHIVLGKLDGKTGELMRARAGRQPWASENTDGTWTVMDGEEIIAREKTKADADEYVAAMKRGDI